MPRQIYNAWVKIFKNIWLLVIDSKLCQLNKRFFRSYSTEEIKKKSYDTQVSIV